MGLRGRKSTVPSAVFGVFWTPLEKPGEYPTFHARPYS